MDVISNILELYPIQVGLVIILVCIVLFLTEIFTSDLQKKKNQQIISWKIFFKKWFFLVIFIIYGLVLIFKNI